MPKREKRATPPGDQRVTKRRHRRCPLSLEKVTAILHLGDEKRCVLRVHYGWDGSTNAAQHKIHKMEKAYNESRGNKIK